MFLHIIVASRLVQDGTTVAASNCCFIDPIDVAVIANVADDNGLSKYAALDKYFSQKEMYKKQWLLLPLNIESHWILCAVFEPFSLYNDDSGKTKSRAAYWWYDPVKKCSPPKV